MVVKVKKEAPNFYDPDNLYNSFQLIPEACFSASTIAAGTSFNLKALY